MAMTGRKHEVRDSREAYASRVRRARIMIVVALVVALEVYGRLFADPAFLQPPSEVVRAWFATVLPDARIMSALGMSVFEIASAYVLSVVFGTAIGLAVGSTALSRQGFYPLILVLYAIPQVSLIPLFVLMGLLVSVSEIGKDTFDVAETLLRRLRGALGVATVAANTVFAAVTGVSIASAAVHSPAYTRL